MRKRRENGLEVVASMPWPVGIGLGLLAYIAIRYGIGWYLGSTDNQYLSGLGKLAATGMYAPLGWILLMGCWTAAVVSFIGRARRRKLLDTQTDINSLRQMSWSQFEQLAGEAFRRQGYAVEETGSGADGGIDLILSRSGKTTLVQCKQWQNKQVGVSVVREMYGLLMHHQAAGVKIVALGDYTRDARQFAHGKPIELIHGGELTATVRSLQNSAPQATRPMDAPLTLAGSMLVSLLVIAVLSLSTHAPDPVAASAPTPAPVIVRPAYLPKPARVRAAPLSAAHPQAAIYMSDPQNDAQLREWKKRNAESMKILEQTTKEMPLR